MRVQDGAGLRFTINNLPSTLDYYLVVRYEPEVCQIFPSIFECLNCLCLLYIHGFYIVVLSLQSTDDWTATVHVVSFGSGDGSCPNDPLDKVFTLPGSAR